MAITDSLGYGGTVTEDLVPLWARSFASTYGVVGAEDWKVTIKVGTPLTAVVAPGEGFGHLVIDTNDDDEVTVAFGSLTSGTRYDMVVAHRDWSGVGGTTTFDVITGTSSQLGAFGLRVTDPGVEDDQPIALVQIVGSVGGGSVGTIYDLRAWGANGGLFAKDELVLQYLNEVGTQITIGTTLFARVLDEVGVAQWRRADLGAPLMRVSAPTTFATNSQGDLTWTFPTPFPNAITSAFAIDAFGSGSGLGGIWARYLPALSNQTKASFRVFYATGSPLVSTAGVVLNVTAFGS